MKLYRGALAITLFSCLALAGCNEQSNSKAANQEASAPADNSLNNYIALNNTLTGISGLEAMQAWYVKQNIAKAKTSQVIDYPSAKFDYAYLQYAEALKNKRSHPALDNAADDLMKKLDAIKKDTATYEQYYESASYKTDGLKKGKEADAQIKQHYANAVASYAVFKSELDVVYKEAKKKELEALKASGNAYQYHKAYSMQLAEELVSVFGSETDLKNPEKLKQAASVADLLQNELAAFNTELQKVKDKNPNGPIDTTLMNLNSCLKYYRSFVESKSEYDFKFMLDGYNSAVRSNRY